MTEPLVGKVLILYAWTSQGFVPLKQVKGEVNMALKILIDWTYLLQVDLILELALQTSN
jgi:hypothetical protein